MFFMEDVVVLKKSKKSGATPSDPRLVCFVCTGNTCRSPMAAAVLNHLARVPELGAVCELPTLRAVSRGLAAHGEPIAANAAKALSDAGIPSLQDNPYREHTSAAIDEETLQRADLIVGMTDAHVFSLLSLFPAYASKITRMPTAISDPYGGDLDEYKACLAELRRGIDILFFGGDAE